MREWLLDLRKKKGLTQKQVANKSLLDRSYYTQIEHGVRTPSPALAKNIAKTLGFNPSRFFTEDFSEPFEVALRNAPIIIAHCDLELRYTWIFNPHPDFNPDSTIGKRDDELAMNQGVRDLMTLKRTVIEGGAVLKQTISFPLSDGVHTYYVFGEPLRNEQGEIVGAVTASTDMSNIILHRQ